MAAKAYTPEIHPEDPPRGRQPLLQATTLRCPLGSPPYSTLLGTTLQLPRHTGTHGGLGHSGQGREELPPPPPLGQQLRRTAMANRPPADRTQARRPHAPPRKSDYASAGRAPAEGPGPAGHTRLLATPHPPSPTTSSPTQASETERRRTCPLPSANLKRRQGNNFPTPCTAPNPPGKPGPSILIILSPTTTTTLPGPSILIMLPPASSTAPTRSVPKFQKGREGPAAFPQRPNGRLDLV